MLTERQKEAVSKAKRFANRNYLTEQFGKQYLSFCDGGYVPPHIFLHYVTETNPVIPINQVIKPTMSFDQYLDVVVRQAKRNTNGKTNKLESSI